MKKSLFTFVFVLTALATFAVNINDTFMGIYYNRFYRNCTITLETSGDTVLISNLMNFGTTIYASYDSVAGTLTIPAGQNFYSSNGTLYNLYTYANDANGTAVNDYTSDIVLNVEEMSAYTKISTEQNLLVATSGGSVWGRYRYISMRNRQNAVLTTDVVYWYDEDSVIRTEQYPVYVSCLGDGQYRIENFGQLGRFFFTTNREESSFVSEYEQYPLVWSSSLQNYFFPAAVTWNSTNSVYTFKSDLDIHGTVDDNQMVFSDAWSLRCDNTNNTDVDAQYRKKYFYRTDVYTNTIITLTDSTLHFQFPHTTHHVTQTELLLTTPENFQTYCGEGWMWCGDVNHEANAVAITNKKSTIEPGTDSIITGTVFPGLNIKENTGTKNIYIRISGVYELKYYVTSNSSSERTACVTAISTEGDTIIHQTPSTSAGAKGQMILDHEKVYTVRFNTLDNLDMTLYALQLMPANASSIERIDDSAVPVQYFTPGGTPLGGPQQGVNIIRLSDGTVRKILLP